MKPIIALSCRDREVNNTEAYYCQQSYMNALEAVNANYIAVVPTKEHNYDYIANMCDGLVLCGGADMDAKYFNEENHESVGLVKECIDLQDLNLIEAFLKAKKPILGIGLGSELIALAYDVKVNKMKCGHHGSNYPVKNIKNGKVEITSQNYSYSFDDESLEKSNLVITRVNVITQEVEGIYDPNCGVMGIQYEPNTPINEDSEDIIKDFVEKMGKLGGKRYA